MTSKIRQELLQEELERGEPDLSQVFETEEGLEAIASLALALYNRKRRNASQDEETLGEH